MTNPDYLDCINRNQEKNAAEAKLGVAVSNATRESASRALRPTQLEGCTVDEVVRYGGAYVFKVKLGEDHRYLRLYGDDEGITYGSLGWEDAAELGYISEDTIETLRVAKDTWEAYKTSQDRRDLIRLINKVGVEIVKEILGGE